MNTERHPIFEIAPRRRRERHGQAFTLVEVLVVIAIIAVLAGLILGMTRYASDQRKISRVQAELAGWTTLIAAYHDKMGFYPPSNTNNPALNPLFYELAGTTNVDADTYQVVNWPETIDAALIQKVFGLGRFINSSADPSELRYSAKSIQPNQLVSVKQDDWAEAVQMPLVAVRGPGPFGEADTVTNTWRYNSFNPTNNPNTYDLWAEVLIGDEVRIIGNWKR